MYIKQDGIPKGVYIRVGSSNRRAQESHIEDLIRDSKHDYFDEEATKAKRTDLSNELLKLCYGKNITERKLLADFVITQETYFKQHHATVAGTLMFCERPDHYIPEAIIMCTQFKGTKGRDIVQTREIKGPIPELTETSLTLIESWLERDFTLQGAKLVGHIAVPRSALREAIINALVHRKYTVAGAVKIALYDDRLEIFSPGAFPGLIDINNLGDGTTCLRNPHLTQLARRLHLIEKLGTGIRLIFDACHEIGIQKPQYSEDGDYVKLTFSFKPCLDKNASEEESLLMLIKRQGKISVADVITTLNISRNTATRKLNTLIEKKLIRREGKGPAVRYCLYK